MRNANSQLANTMSLVRAAYQPSAPHVSHAEIGGYNPHPVPRENASVYGDQDGQRCALLTTKSRKTCTRATVFNSSG